TVERGRFFFSSRRRHTRCLSDGSSDVCSSDLAADQSGRGHDSTTIWGSPAYVAGSGSMGAVAIDCPPGGIFGSGFNVADAPDLVLTNEFTLEAAVVARYDSQGSRRVIVGRNGSYKNSYELGYYPDTDQFTLAVYRPQG